MKKNIFKFSVLTLAVLSLTACTLVPGQNLSTSNKDVIELPDNQYDLDKMVNIYPVTPGLIDQLRAKPIMSQLTRSWSSKSQTMNIVSGLVMC